MLINPYRAEEIADAVLLALRMDKTERIRRWRLLMDSVSQEDVVWWRQRFLAALLDTASNQDR